MIDWPARKWAGSINFKERQFSVMSHVLDASHTHFIVVSCPGPARSQGNGLVTIERFLGCADSAVLILNKR